MKFFPHVIAHAIGFTAALCTTSHTVAQTFPVKPIRIIVPATPGGGTDILSRLLSPKLTEYLGQSMVIENRAGASTNIGTEFVARSAPDGYTVLMATTPHAINPSLFTKLSFDPLRDFTMISQLALTQNVLLTHPSLPVNNVIPYKGAGLALNDIIAGHLQFQVNTTLATIQFIQTGKLRAIATCGNKRTTTLPHVPTVAETIPGFESSGWYALLGPAGLPRDVTLRLHAAFSKSLQAPDVVRRLTEQGVEIIAGSPEELTKLMPLEISKWAAAVKASGAKGN